MVDGRTALTVAGWNRFGEMAATGEIPLAVSTLRGELADNEQWKADLIPAGDYHWHD